MSIGSVSSARAQSHQATPPQGAPTGKFNPKLISGLRKNGNGVVVKVPAGVRSLAIRSMRSPSGKTNLSKAEPIRIAFGNNSKDNFIALRLDQNGNIQATVISDLAAESELSAKLKGDDSDIGIINGQDKSLNERSNLRIRESISGNTHASEMRFMLGVRLTNVSSRLSTLFSKFKSMKEERTKKHSGIIKHFKPVQRRQKDSQNQQQSQEQQQRVNQTDKDSTKTETFSEKQKLEIKNKLIAGALSDIGKKIQSTQEILDASSLEPRSTRSEGHTQLQALLGSYRRGQYLLTQENHTKKDKQDYAKLMVGIYMDNKKILYHEYHQTTQKQIALKREITQGKASDKNKTPNKETLEKEKQSLNQAKDSLRAHIRLMNEFIRQYGGHSILMTR